MPNKFGVKFPLGGKKQYSSAFQPISVPDLPLSPLSVTHMSLGKCAEVCVCVYTHVRAHTRLRALCSLPQVSALSSAGGVENLILLEQEKHRPHEVGSVQWAGSTFGPMQKSRLGEHEFEALMRMLDNLVSLLPWSSEASLLRLSPRTSEEYNLFLVRRLP